MEKFAHWQRPKKGKWFTAVDGVIPPADLDFITRYALWREATEEWEGDPQSPGMFAAYSDPVFLFNQARLHPIMEEVTGLRLHQTYNYFRVYRRGAVLAHHFDRAACEVSCTMHIGSNYGGGWPICAQHESEGEVAIAQKPGDMIAYRGNEVDHWRDPFDPALYGGNGDSYHVQVFTHYVDADGPYADMAGDQKI